MARYTRWRQVSKWVLVRAKLIGFQQEQTGLAVHHSARKTRATEEVYISSSLYEVVIQLTFKTCEIAYYMGVMEAAHHRKEELKDIKCARERGQDHVVSEFQFHRRCTTLSEEDC
ncbi:hypothetical protein CY34DRAFT_558935 [Suillus luteus UH-Slu-Lm8-n1]|uniref:Uncharacterized protein n=1 Tax=Suillus luteus UH-Slu-Lm8-n1 TaxID=930992 RepID=A0A0D0AU08_9AGAM|nr:hypothetical protein CY34DRAFT_558935 [Suillus luteus UH-Slu-Lm8-n1]